MVLLRHLLGDVLRRLRLRQGRTLREVSASARVSLGYLSEVERGQKEASSELLSAICTALETPLSHVLREVSDNFALAELQSNPVLSGPREPGLHREPAMRDGSGPARGAGGSGPGRAAGAGSRHRTAASRPAGAAVGRLRAGHGRPGVPPVGAPPRRRHRHGPGLNTGPAQVGTTARPFPSRHRHGPGVNTGLIFHAQARGSPTSSVTVSGSSPDTIWSSVTSSRIARSLARSAIHTRCSGSAAPM